MPAEDLLTLDELESLGVNPVAIGSFTPQQQQLAVLAAIDEAYAYIRQVTTTPLLNAPLALKAHVAKIAVYHLLSARGMDPVEDRLVVDNYERAIRFLTGVRKREIVLEGMTPPEEGNAGGSEDYLGEPSVFSDPSRFGDGGIFGRGV